MEPLLEMKIAGAERHNSSNGSLLVTKVSITASPQVHANAANDSKRNFLKIK